MSTEAMKLALEALEGIHPGNMTPMAEEYWNKAITALREALAEQPAQPQPVAWPRDAIVVNLMREGVNKHRARELADHFINLTSPPAQRMPLTKTKIGNYLRRHTHGEVGMYRNGFKDGVAFAEAAHGIKENT